MNAYVLFSGGIDSTVALVLALRDYENVEAISIDYGQRHYKELGRAKSIADWYGVPWNTLSVYMEKNSLLTDASKPLPDVSYAQLPAGLSPAYVPFRNAQLLSRITAYASSQEEPAVIYAGMHMADDLEKNPYPDCSLPFLGAMAAAIYIGTNQQIRLVTPLASMRKWEVIQTGQRLDVDFASTWSCYDSKDVHCGKCPTCHSRRDAFHFAGVLDPTIYDYEP